MLRGAMFFLVGLFSRWSKGPRLSGRAFLVGFRTDSVTSVWVSDAFAGVLALAALRPAGVRKPQWGAPLPPPCVHPCITCTEKPKYVCSRHHTRFRELDVCR